MLYYADYRTDSMVYGSQICLDLKLRSLFVAKLKMYPAFKFATSIEKDVLWVFGTMRDLLCLLEG